MNRRGFLGAMGALVGGVALEQAIPFNRVWSFPSKVTLREQQFIILRDWMSRIEFNQRFDEEFCRQFKVGDVIQIRIPQRYVVWPLTD